MGLRAFCEHITAHTGETIRIELDSAGYSGSPLELIGTGRSPLWFSHEYEQLNKANVYDTIIQKSYAEFNFHNRGSAEQTLLDEILSATEGTFKLTKKINGAVDWVGVVLGDLSGFNDGEATPFPVKIVAKDFTPLSGTLFAEFSLRKTIAKVVAEIVGTLGYSLPIHTRTSWVTSDTDANNDFMRQVFVGGFPLTDRDNLDPVLITNEEALNRLLSPYKCIIKITNGVFLIEQLSAYSTPTSVLTTVYDTNGDFVSQSNVNTVKAANTDIKVVTGSVNEVKPAYKRVRATYNHRTNISGIILPEDIQPGFTGPPEALVDDPVIFTQDFVADGTTSISLNGVVVVKPLPTFVINQDFPPVARIEIKVNYSGGSYWWDINANTWQISQVINIIRLDATGRGIVFTGTTPVPQFPASTQLQCLFYASDVQPPSTTNYLYFILDLVSDNKPATQNSIQYELVQAGQFSNEFDSGAFWFGDGPTAFSPSALTRSTLSTDLTTTWQRRGTTPNRPMHENLLAEIMDSHRSYGRMLDAILRDGTYSPYNSLSYDLLSFYFIGGSFDAYTGEWQITAIQNAFFTSVTDTLNVGVIAGPSLITSGLFTAARLASNNAIEASGGYSFRTTVALSGTVSQIFVQSTGTTTPQLDKDSLIRVVHPVTLQDFDFVVSQTMTGGSNVIPVVPKSITGVIPVGSWVFTNTADATTAILLGRNAIRAISRSTAVGELATASLGPVTSIEVNLFSKVREGDDLFMINVDNGTDRSFTVGQTAGPGLVTLQVDPVTVFDSPVGSYIVGSNAQYEGLLQITPAGVLAKAEAITTQNAFAILSAPLSVGSVSIIPVTSVRAIKLNAGTAIGLQDRAGNTVFFTIDVTQTLTVASTSISVTTESISTAIGAGASVFQPMWNQSAQLSIQADQIALRVTETQVQTLIDENIGGLIPAVNFTFQNTNEGFTTNNVTLTTQPTYIEYLATGAGAYIQKSGLSIDSADNPVVTIRVVRIAGTNWNGAFGWSTDGTNFFSQSFAEPSNVDNDFSFATIDLTGNANYTGTITHIRLFLGNANNDEFYIDQISVGKFNPQTQILEDLSTRLSASESAITVESDRIDLFTQKSNELNRIAEVTGTYNQSSTFTSITLTNTRSGFEVRNGQTLFLVNVDGTFQSVTVNGNQTLSTSVTINSEVFATTIIAGAMLYESSFTSSSRITQQAGTIVLKAEQVSGGTTPISKLALVRLDTSAADGSSILLQADQITLDGQTTFLNSLATNRFTQVASNNIVIESGTAPTQRPNASQLQIGDVWRDTANNNRPSVWNGAIWGRGFTVINGGTITTGTVSADRIDVTGIFATNATIASTLTMGSGGVITSSVGSAGYIINNNSIVFAESIGGSGDISTVTHTGLTLTGTALGDFGFFKFGEMLVATNRSSPLTGHARLRFSIANSFYELYDQNGLGIFEYKTDSGNIRYFAGSGGTFRVDRPIQARKGVQVYDTDESNFATIAYADSTADRTYTIPNVAASDFVMSEGNQTIAGNKTFTGTVTVPSLVLGSAAAKATIAYTTNTARTYTIPNVAASDFVMTQGAQTISGVKTFSSRIEAGGDIRLYDTAAQFINLSGSTTTLTANRTYTFPDANGEFVITAGNQDIAGTKRFTGTLRASAYRSSDNTAGATEQVDTGAVILNFKNGLFVGTL
jgi:hypothetical protein